MCSTVNQLHIHPPFLRFSSHIGITGNHRIPCGFPGRSVVKNPPAKVGDLDLVPGLGGSLGEKMETLSNRQRSLAGYSAWGHRVRHDLVTENTFLMYSKFLLVLVLYIVVYIHPSLPIYPSLHLTRITLHLLSTSITLFLFCK